MKNRKILFENESIKAYNPTKKEEKEFRKADKDNDFEVDLGDDFKVKFSGFTIARDKVTNKIHFAYKLKHNENVMLYYIPEETNVLDKQQILNALNELTGIIPYELQDVKDALKSIKAERHRFDNLTKSRSKK
jgi:hypothetical protein